MGFLDRNVSGSFDELFDFDRDGSLDITEQGLQYSFLERELEAERRSAELDLDTDLDLDELEYMDEDERREALEEAGYDLDEFDDFGDDGFGDDF